MRSNHCEIRLRIDCAGVLDKIALQQPVSLLMYLFFGGSI
ncbi:hypothetical protein XSR1_490006 [Xenorhabdus szentirmaii DSM 16338]|uniref:Uncharacterized protein n=1 Tax=Xenorhabdus szentirmaii DSM 16338 TaxID=1427518 RepID=W1J3W2_9GAMM|nr:hypothetical protein XSR1_490006 [Xenorhabdus szentirmaii DSM 16338]